MRARIEAIPDGVYRGEKAIDDDVASDKPLTIRVDLTIKGSEAAFDFSRSDPQSPRYMNSTDAFTRSMATLTLFATLEHEESNHGSVRPLGFVNPDGALHQCRLPRLDRAGDLLHGRMRPGSGAAGAGAGRAGQGRRAEHETDIPADRLYASGKKAAGC